MTNWHADTTRQGRRLQAGSPLTGIADWRTGDAVTDSIDPHEITTRMATKLAHGETLTDDEQRQLDDARATIMDTPEIRAFEDAMMQAIAVDAARQAAELDALIEDVKATARSRGACMDWPLCSPSCQRCELTSEDLP